MPQRAYCGLLDKAAAGLLIPALIAAMILSGCSVGNEENESDSVSEPASASTQAESLVSADDPLGVRSFVIGDHSAQIESADKDGETVYLIHIALPIETEFNKVAVNLELAPGASLSNESNCIITDLVGRPVINMTVEDAKLVVENAGQSREYRFLIDLL